MNIGIVGAGAISGIYLQNLTQRFPGCRVVSASSAFEIPDLFLSL